MSEHQRYLSGDLADRMAAIDIGSNSIRLVVAEALRGGTYRVLDEERETTRLSRHLQSTGMLDEQAVHESLAALRRFKQITEGYQCNQLRTIATCAVREAKNGREFCGRALAELDLEIEVISAEEEAHLAFSSVRRSFDLRDKNIVLADIGGGSTEIVLASGNLIEAIYATDLGAVRISEIYDRGPTVVGDDYRRMIVAIDERLHSKTKNAPLAPHLLIGSGGTFTSLAAMIMAQKNQVGLPLGGYQISRAELIHLLDRLRKVPAKARAGTPGLSPERSDIIVAGLAIIDRIMGRFKINLLQVHNRGVRDGLLLAMLDRSENSTRLRTVDRDAAIDRLASTCGTDLAHGRHVAYLAGEIFAQLSEPLGLDPADRTILSAAARLQDVGYLIDYERHHKHSYHLILNSSLPGFQPSQLQIIANVARYHRGAEPKKKHANFSQLSRGDQHRVKFLAAILRIAGGLDRSHSQQVQAVIATAGDDEVELRIAAEQYPDVDLWGARRRTRLFERVFKRTISIVWDGQTGPEEPGDNNPQQANPQQANIVR